MKVINLGEKNTVLNKFVAQMRDKGIQKDSMRFRRNLERLGEIFAYEISHQLDYSVKEVVTPLGIANVPTPDSKVVVSTILRAGLPLHQGILNYFDDAQNAFVAAYRKYDKGEDFHINIEYCSTPDLTGKVAEKALVSADITVNKNMVPFDSRSAFQTSGIRLGTPAITTRGAKEDLMIEIAEMIETVLSNVDNEEVIAQVRARVNEKMKAYPLFAY